MTSVSPVCSNCGGAEFVWVNNLRTGTIGRGNLSLRAGGELSLGTRVCRGCGHADLFLKDPTILRQPHTWKPGEFVPIPPRPTPAAPKPGAPPSSPAAPLAPAPVAPPGPGAASPPSAPAAAPPMPAPPTPAKGPEPPDSAVSGASESSAGPSPPEADAGAKKPARRRTPKPKTGAPPITQD